MKKIILTLILSFIIPASSYAQDQSNRIFPDSENVPPELLNLQNRNDVTDVLESTVIKDKYAGKYQKSTIENLSRLYWLKGVLKFDNDKALDNFILINECDFYKKNINNDFKWREVREAVRGMIKEDLPTYSDKYKIIVPIDLGRYDANKKGFPLVNGTEFKNLKRVEVGGNDGSICGMQWEVEHYPRNARLVLNKPFNYTFMELDEHLAQAYILRNNITKPERPEEIRSKAFNRLAFARIRMSFMEFQKVAKERNRTKVAVIFGKVDGVDVFENADETGLLSTVDF